MTPMSKAFSFSIVTLVVIFINMVGKFPSAFPVATGDIDRNHNSFLQENLAQVFDLGSGIFAAFILIISLIAYRNLKTKRLLFISAAFALFCVRSILSRLDIFMPETLELLLAVSSFVGLVFFFLAILQSGKLKLKNTSSN